MKHGQSQDNSPDVRSQGNIMLMSPGDKEDGNDDSVIKMQPSPHILIDLKQNSPMTGEYRHSSAGDNINLDDPALEHAGTSNQKGDAPENRAISNFEPEALDFGEPE
jgi:hypothetical protein